MCTKIDYYSACEYGLISLEYTDLTLEGLTYEPSSMFDLGYDILESETEDSDGDTESTDSPSSVVEQPSTSITESQESSDDYSDSFVEPPPKRRKVMIDGVQLYYPCDRCKNVYSSQSFLDKHIEYSHSKSRKKTFHCNLCDMRFARSFSLDQHKLMHERRRAATSRGKS